MQLFFATGTTVNVIFFSFRFEDFSPAQTIMLKTAIYCTMIQLLSIMLLDVMGFSLLN